jgi:GAF domain-containing protein/DNA-binding NarL/FixJ family response regulator
MAGEKILIVEDDRDLARLVATLMQQSGYQTVITYDGVEGLNLALQEHPDLILLDLLLPRMDGMQLLHKLHDRQMRAPVVILTAWGSEEMAVQALRLGVKDYINKPFDLKELLEAAERALAEVRLRRERDMLTKQLLISNQALERQVRQLTALYEVGQALAATLDPDDLLDVILQEACRVLELSEASFFLLDAQTGELVFRTGTGEWADRLVGKRLAPGQGIAGWVAEHGEPLLIHQAQSDPRFSPVFDEITGLVTKSVLCVPLMIKGRVIGVVEALNKSGDGFTDDDLALLRPLAASAAVSIENAQLFEETHRLHRQTELQLAHTTRAYSEVRALQETTGALLSSLDLQEVLNQIVDSVVSVLGYRAAMLAEYDEQNHALPVRAIAADPVLVEAFERQVGLRVLDTYVTMDQTENLAVRAALAGEITVTHDLYDLFCPWVTPETAQMMQTAAGIRTLATIPLLVKGRLVGNMFVGSQKSQLSKTDLNSLQTLANQAAIAIEHARLYQHPRESRDQVAERSEALEKRLSLHPKPRELRDQVTAREEAPKKRLSELSRLQQLTLELGKLASGAHLREVFKRLTEYTATLLEARSSAILLFDPERKELVCQEPAFGIPIDIVREYRIPLSKDSPAWATWESGGPLVINDVVGDPLVRGLGLEKLAQRIGLRPTLLSVLRVGGQAIGLLQVSDKRDGSDFTLDDARLLEIFASQSAIAIQNARFSQTIRAYQEQQVDEERMAAMIDIAGNMVHRINNAVGAVRPLVQQVEMKLDQGKLDEQYLREKLLGVREGADRALEVARRISTPFKSVPFQPIDVNASIQAAWADLTPPVGVDVDFDHGVNLPPVTATPQLDEVFCNLMKNALDAMADAGGFLSVRSRRRDERTIVVTVKDTGPGIPLRIREKIFRLGTTTKPGGMGYGLWWSRTFLRRLGGDIAVESEEGRGCVLTVTLPISEG